MYFFRLNRLTTDFNVIVEALSKSKAELMEISEDKTKIRRSPSKPLPEVTDEYKNDVKNRSVFIVSGDNIFYLIELLLELNGKKTHITWDKIFDILLAPSTYQLLFTNS